MTRRGGGALFVALLLVGANIRSPLTSLPPLVEKVGGDLGLSPTAAGALTSLPLICMGLLAPLAPRLAARIGADRTIALGTALIALGTAGRAVGGVGGLYAGTVVLGAGIAVVGALLPGAIRRFLPDRVGSATSLINALTMAFAAGSAATVAPLATWVGWPVALAVWAVPAVVALAVWSPLVRRAPERAATQPATGLPWTSSTAWLITAFLTANSIAFYSLVAWLPSVYLDRGWSATTAGFVLGVFNAWQLIGALLLTATLHRWGADRRVLYATTSAMSVVGLTAVALVPGFVPWVVVSVLGLGLGAGFTLGLIQLAAHAVTPMDSARLSAMAFFVSFLVAAAGPAVVGVLHDARGSFTVPFLALAVIIAAQLPIATRLHPDRRVGDTNQRPAP